MSEIVKSEVKKLEQEFVAEFTAGIQGIVKASNILVRLVEIDTQARARLIDEYNIPRATIATMERIGNKQLRPELAFGDRRFQSLPMHEQERIIAGKVEAMVMKDDGQTDVLLVDLKTTTPEIRNQVLNADHIRTLPEQKAYLVGKANRQHQPVREVETVPWKTYGQRQVIVMAANTVLNRSDLLSMMKAIEG